MDEQMITAEAKFPNEKRVYPRIPLNSSVRYRILGGEELERAMNRYFDADKILAEKHVETETVNVSKEGMLMYTNEEIPIKSMLAVNLYIAVPGISCNCKALGEVVRREKETENERYGYKVAVRFHKIVHHNLKSYKYLDLPDLLNIKEIPQS